MGTPYIIFSSVIPAGLATTRYRAPLNAFPARNLGYISNDKAVARRVLLHQRVFWSELQYSLIQQKPLILSGFIIAFISLVIPAGFEPTTHSLEGCCSIQLSYGTRPCRTLLQVKQVQK